MNVVTCWFLFAGMGGLFFATLPASTAEEKSSAVAVSSDSTNLSKGSDLWNQALEVRNLWLKSENFLNARELSEKYVALLQRAAETGDIRAMVALGRFFTRGTNGFPVDTGKAQGYFERAAELGDADSLYHLGYLAEQKGPTNKEEAQRFYSKALDIFKGRAETGDLDAMFWYGLMLQKGQGTKKNVKQAYTWLTKASEGNHLQAQILCAFMSREGLGCDSSEDVAFKWFSKAADQNDVGAIVETALCFSQGNGVQKDEKAARAQLQKAARMSDPFALRMLADMYVDGVGGEKDIQKALGYYRQAASLGEGWSAIRAYEMLISGKDVPQDKDAALKILKRAGEELNFPPARFKLGLFEREHGNKKRGNALIERSAKDGNVSAMTMLASFHLIPGSEGISWNPVLAYHWFKIAAERGDERASSRLHWLLWGGGAFLVITMTLFLMWMNHIIKRNRTLLDTEEKESAK